MADRFPAPVTSAGIDRWTMEDIAINEPNDKKKRSGGWSLGSGTMKSRDGWFKNPRDTSWTIDSAVNGKKKPSGYDSNTLITVVRSSQCFAACMVLILYVSTTSAPAQWLTIFAAAAGGLSAIWSIFVLFLRHVWSIWLVIPEILIAVAWMVLFGVSSDARPDVLKSETFRVGMVAIEASMVLWIQTCLLAVTPFFHKLVPWVLGKARRYRRNRKASKPDEAVPKGIEMVS
ncbi:hypothetical protein GGR52DRAFT_330874 [Hypoxylon sp. FL1284]|nr:hypothetical protein GGR52DRAFT_330874 [Hypoxylon sp. FL1284]